jgi:hypothetical protein
MVDPIGGGGDVKVPGLGDVQKKYVIGGVIVGTGIAIVVYIRIRGQAASTATTTAVPADTSGDDSGIDPDTGIPYADEEGSGVLDGGGEIGDYSDQTDDDAAGYPIGSQADLTWQAQQSSGVTTNEEWVQACLGDLPGDQATIQAALLGVLAGQTVTTAQKQLFLEGVALNENPPQGYPTPIKTSDTAQQPGTPTSTSVVVPRTVGQSQEAAFAILSAAGFRETGTPVVKGKTLIVQSTTPAAGTSAAKGSTVVVHSAVPKGK